jgi:hypothetical protein
MLALVFGDRPARVWIDSSLPNALRSTGVVSYGAPQILPPSKEALAEYDRALGRDGWSPWTRRMRVGYDDAADVWMQVGDRRPVGVVEEQSRGIDALNSRRDFSVAAWTSSDSSVVGLAPSNESPYGVILVALRPGKSTVAVDGLRGPSDELPRSPRVHTLTRTVIVTNRLTGLRITPRPTEMAAGSRFGLVARVVDEYGAFVEGAPVEFFVIYDMPDQHGWEGKKYESAADVDLTTPGRRRFIARYKTFADTLDVRVVPRR